MLAMMLIASGLLTPILATYLYFTGKKKDRVIQGLNVDIKNLESIIMKYDKQKVKTKAR